MTATEIINVQPTVTQPSDNLVHKLKLHSKTPKALHGPKIWHYKHMGIKAVTFVWKNYCSKEFVSKVKNYFFKFSTSMGKHCILCAGKCILKSQYVTHLVGINYGKWHFNIWERIWRYDTLNNFENFSRCRKRIH